MSEFKFDKSRVAFELPLDAELPWRTTKSPAGAFTTIAALPETLANSDCTAAGEVSLPTPKTTPLPLFAIVRVWPFAIDVL